MVSEKLGAAFMEVGADLGPLEKSLGSIPGMMQHAGTNITGGLKASLQGGNFTDVGKQLGNQLVTGMTSQFGMLGQAAGTFATALGPAGIALLGIGASIAVIGVGLGKCVSSAATWQDLMVDVQKVTNTTEAGFSKLSSDLLAIRGSTGASMESIAGAAAGAGRMGIDPTEIAGYTETILKMSSAWGMSADAASESIGKIGSVVKPAEMTWTEFGNRMGSTINDLADSMATSEESIVTGMKKVSAQMAMLKPSPDQLSAWAALIGQLQAFGMTAETSGESLKDALNYMMRDDKSGISSMLDMDATEFQEAIREDAIGTIQELAVAISELPIEEQGQALQKFGATGGQMMGMLVGKVDPVTKEIEGLNTALATGSSAWEKATSLNDAYLKSQATLNTQIEIFKGKISTAAVSIGTVLLPYLTQMMEAVNDITQALIDLGTRGWQWLTGGAEGENVTERAAGKVRSWADSQGWLSGYLADYDAAKARDAGVDLGQDLTTGVVEGTAGIEPAVTEAVEGGLTDPNIKETAKKTGEEAGSAAGSGYMKAWNDKMKRWADYHEKTVQRFSRTGTVSVGSDTIEIIHTPDAQLEWAVHINGKSLTGLAYDSPQAAMNAIRTQFPGLWALIDPVEREAALLDALGKYGEAAEMRAEIIIGEKFEAEWKAQQEELNRILDEQSKMQADAIAKAMGEGVIIDWMTAWEDAGEEAAKVFADNLVSGMEAQDMVDRLEVLQLYDPAKFEEMGGEAALSWWQGLTDLLEQRAELKAVDIKADTSEIDNQIADAIKAGEPYIAEVTAKVSPEASALREALFWEEYDGSKTKKGLREFADDLYSLSQSLSELGSDAEAAYRIITNPWDYEKSTVSLAKDFLLSVIPKEIDPEAIDAIAKYFTKVGKAGLEKASAETTTSIMPGWWSGFGAWQEAQEDMFARSYIGPTEGWAGPGQGAKEGYEAQNYFQYAVEVDLELDPAAANTELEKLEGDIKTEKIAPVLADISPAMTELDRLEAEIMAPTTKPIWLEVMNPEVLDTGGSSGGNYAGGTLASSGWLSFAPGGIISSPVRAVVGDARTPEVVAPLGDLLPMIQQAVVSTGASGGEIHIGEINVYSTGDAEEVARAVVEELKVEISKAYVDGRSSVLVGGLRR